MNTSNSRYGRVDVANRGGYPKNDRVGYPKPEPETNPKARKPKSFGYPTRTRFDPVRKPEKPDPKPDPNPPLVVNSNGNLGFMSDTKGTSPCTDCAFIWIDGLLAYRKQLLFWWICSPCSLINRWSRPGTICRAVLIISDPLWEAQKGAARSVREFQRVVSDLDLMICDSLAEMPKAQYDGQLTYVIGR
uniref:SLC12 domain-containing protein n=1 Tax=Steinernema glaseri TaxID=37863 RepID=A0A1I8AFW2_9BILA